jgi:hypothetical protein
MSNSEQITYAVGFVPGDGAVVALLRARLIEPGQFLMSNNELTILKLVLCRGWDSNPYALCRTQDFKSCASTNSATPAMLFTMSDL